MDERICASPECEQAAAPRVRSNGPHPAYCSKRCQNRAQYLRTGGVSNERRRMSPRDPIPCEVCAQAFTPRSARSRTCSAACLKKLHRDSSTRVCSNADCGRPTRANGMCSKHYKASHPNRKSWKKNGRPEVRRAALRKRTQLRRALTRDPAAEPIDREEIGVRDGWKCGLCHTRVHNSLPYPHPKSPSLDHILPLSEGGKHVRTNVQIAHLKCNVAKGARGGGEQLLLIG